MNFPVEWLAYGSVALTIGVVISLIAVNKRLARELRLQHEQSLRLASEIQALNQQLALINKGTLGMGKRLMTAEKRLNQTMERQDAMENTDSEQISFKQAAKLFERGLEMDNVIEKVGITRSEAKLLDMFQQKQAFDLEEDKL